MMMMNYSHEQLIFIILTCIITSIETSSCLPGLIGTCGCCDSIRTKCIEIPYTILNFVTPNYICVEKNISSNFSFNNCNCTLKDPPLCFCFNGKHVFPIYTQCDSFAECAIADILVKAKHQILDTLCKLPIRTGRCSHRLTSRYYFDFHQNRCKEFMYSGCSANRNTFFTQNSCEHTCQF